MRPPAALKAFARDCWFALAWELYRAPDDSEEVLAAMHNAFLRGVAAHPISGVASVNRSRETIAAPFLFFPPFFSPSHSSVHPRASRARPEGDAISAWHESRCSAAREIISSEMTGYGFHVFFFFLIAKQYAYFCTLRLRAIKIASKSRRREKELRYCKRVANFFDRNSRIFRRSTTTTTSRSRGFPFLCSSFPKLIF